MTGYLEEDKRLRVLLVTSEWPTNEHPEWGTFVVQHVNFLRRAGVMMDVFSFKGRQNPISYARNWFRIHRKLRSGKYDLVHAHWAHSALLAFSWKVPLVVTFHGSDVQGTVTKNDRRKLSGRLLPWVSRFVARLADEVIVVARHQVPLLPKRPYHLIPLGVDFERFYPIPQKEGLSVDKPIVLFGGMPQNPVKRFWLAKQSVENLRDVMPDVQLLVMERIPHDRVVYFMNAADVLLVTSLHEGSPTVVKEALACGTPVVSVDVGDVRERIKSCSGCTLCSDDQAKTITQALLKVLSRRKRLPHLLKEIRDLDETRVCEKVVSVYKRSLMYETASE
jgi:teichuronic acid biosynthesis glycosyltransferase TuaC